jgi:hypothetical protein
LALHQRHCKYSETFSQSGQPRPDRAAMHSKFSVFMLPNATERFSVHLFRKGSLHFCGRLIGGTAAYALLLNLVLAGLLGAQIAATSNSGDAAFELCLAGDGGPSGSGGQSPGHVAGKIHCGLCTAGGAMASVPAQSAAVAVVFSPAAIFARPAFDDDALASVRYLSPSPRGPPQQA